MKHFLLIFLLLSCPSYAVSVSDTLQAAIAAEPFRLWTAIVFFLAVLHTLFARKFTQFAEWVEHRQAIEGIHDSPLPKILHYFGEVEVIFGIWIFPLVAVLAYFHDFDYAVHYFDKLFFVEPLFVLTVMVVSSTRPIVDFVEMLLEKAARLLTVITGDAAEIPVWAWWLVILVITPLLGSFITEPASMTIACIVLRRQFFDANPSSKLKFATLGLLFTATSVGGLLTHFAAPCVLMVASKWGWSDNAFTVFHLFGWKAIIIVLVSVLSYFVIFRRELLSLVRTPSTELPIEGESNLPVPYYVTAVHLLFLALVVSFSHYVTIFLGLLIFFVGFFQATGKYQSPLNWHAPISVGFFLAALVCHGALQGWWIDPVITSLTEPQLVGASVVLSMFNDNAAITYLASQIPDLAENLRYTLVAAAVAAGGLTVIANAPNPAGQSYLHSYFEKGISPVKLFAGAFLPTIIALGIFMLLR